MAFPQLLHFPHVHNLNGTHDSVCARCHLTIASAKHEAQLNPYEQAHRCDPVRLYQFSQGRTPANYSRLPVAN